MALLALLPLPLLMTIVVMTIIGGDDTDCSNISRGFLSVFCPMGEPELWQERAFASLSEVTLQLSLRRRWDHHCLQEAGTSIRVSGVLG